MLPNLRAILHTIFVTHVQVHSSSLDLDNSALAFHLRRCRSPTPCLELRTTLLGKHPMTPGVSWLNTTTSTQLLTIIIVMGICGQIHLCGALKELLVSLMNRHTSDAGMT